MVKFGCLGVGHMGFALAQAVAKAVGPRQVMVSSRTREKAEAVAAQLGCAAGENRDLAAQCEYLLLGVKPQVMPGVLEDLAPAFQARSAPCVLVSMAAGISLAQLHTLARSCASCPTPRFPWGRVWCCMRRMNVSRRSRNRSWLRR